MYQRKRYEELANAIIIQAVKDYRFSWKKSKSGQAERQQIQKFFRSRLFANITKVNPEYLINKLEAEHK